MILVRCDTPTMDTTDGDDDDDYDDSSNNSGIIEQIIFKQINFIE